MEKQFCRVNLIGDEDGTYYGPFDDFEPAARFGEMVINAQLESFTVVGAEDIPEGKTIIDPMNVDIPESSI